MVKKIITFIGLFFCLCLLSACNISLKSDCGSKLYQAESRIYESFK